jgi:hypothetical protein
VKNGMKLGHKLKQNVSMPEWITASKKYTIACIRGMVDTDGCIVKETHVIRKKKYIYRRLNFTSASPNLVHQTVAELEKLGFHPKIRRNGRSIQLEKLSEICDYFEHIGTHNPKHMRRFKEEWQSGRLHRS